MGASRYLLEAGNVLRQRGSRRRRQRRRRVGGSAAGGRRYPDRTWPQSEIRQTAPQAAGTTRCIRRPAVQLWAALHPASLERAVVHLLNLVHALPQAPEQPLQRARSPSRRHSPVCGQEEPDLECRLPGRRCERQLCPTSGVGCLRCAVSRRRQRRCRKRVWVGSAALLYSFNIRMRCSCWLPWASLPADGPVPGSCTI